MSFYSFRDRPRLSERLRGKSGDELFKELRKELDQDRKSFFDSPSSNWGTPTGSSFPRAGHLFEDPLVRGHTDIKSHLEDLAQRHPEFADQLRYPAWSNDNRSSTWGRKRRGSGQPDTGEASKQQPQERPQAEDSEEPLRGRPKENLRNTVPDMGQKQQQETEEKESRGQRSWSAPPDNRTQQDKPRFISKIEINPVNPDATQTPTGDATKPPMAPPKPQPQSQTPQQPTPPQPKHSTVRHIPIFVEGRDEPVLPKNIEPEFTQTQAPPQQHFARSPPQPQYTSSQHHYQPQHQPARKQTPPQQAHPRYEQQAQPKPEPTIPEQQQETPSVNPRDPLFRVGCVQKEVDDLKAKVESFSGNSRSDKEYVILDELLTRNLIKLDDIETEGKEEVRAARKNTIKSIQRCISVLENKVPVPGSEKKELEAMEVEQQPSEAENNSVVKSQQGEVFHEKSEQSSNDKQMEVESSQETNLPKQLQELNNSNEVQTDQDEMVADHSANKVPSEGEKKLGDDSKDVSPKQVSENKEKHGDDRKEESPKPVSDKKAA